MRMSRFEKSYNGLLGDYWKKQAEKEVSEIYEKALNGEIAVNENYAAYWVKSGNYLPEDCVQKLECTPFDFDPDVTHYARMAQIDQFISEYRKQDHTPSAEMLYELKANFEPGTTVVNILTGNKVVV